MADFITLMPLSNSIYFSPDVASGLNILGQAAYGQQILPWQFAQPYQQKVCYTDDITIMTHTQLTAAAAVLRICSNVRDKDGKPTVIATIDISNYPYNKGSQNVGGNTYYNPFTGITTQLTTTLWNFKFNDFLSDLVGDGIYYLRFDNYALGGGSFITFYSEPIYLRTSHPNTSLYQFTYNANNAIKNIVVTSWFSDVGETIPYNPLFTIRAETYLLPTDIKAINIGYMQQNYDQNQIMTLQKPLFTLRVGELSIGIPFYMLQMLTEAVLSDLLLIDRFAYVVFNPSSQTSLGDVWKIKRSDNAPLVWGSTTLMLLYDAQQAMLNPVVTPYEDIYTGVYSDVFM